MLYANYIKLQWYTFDRSAAKKQKPSETKNQKTQQKPKTKNEMNMQIGDVSSKMQQITCKSEMSVPNCSK